MQLLSLFCRILFWRLYHLTRNQVRLLVVFDGPCPNLKAAAVAKRGRKPSMSMNNNGNSKFQSWVEEVEQLFFLLEDWVFYSWVHLVGILNGIAFTVSRSITKNWPWTKECTLFKASHGLEFYHQFTQAAHVCICLVALFHTYIHKCVCIHILLTYIHGESEKNMSLHQSINPIY